MSQQGKDQYQSYRPFPGQREVLRLHLDNKPGSFAIVVSRLGTAGISINYCYGTVGKGQKDASVILDVEDIDRAKSVLQGAER